MPYLEQLGEMLEREERSTVYNYLMWRVVMELMPYLPLRSSAISKQNKLKKREEHQSKNHQTANTKITKDTK
jgi:hypothetical protein